MILSIKMSSVFVDKCNSVSSLTEVSSCSLQHFNRFHPVEDGAASKYFIRHHRWREAYSSLSQKFSLACRCNANAYKYTLFLARAVSISKLVFGNNPHPFRPQPDFNEYRWDFRTESKATGSHSCTRSAASPTKSSVAGNAGEEEEEKEEGGGGIIDAAWLGISLEPTWLQLEHCQRNYHWR